MPEVHAEEIKVCPGKQTRAPGCTYLVFQTSAPVDSNDDQCAEIIKAKETCLSEVSKLSQRVKSLSGCHLEFSADAIEYQRYGLDECNFFENLQSVISFKQELSKDASKSYFI